MRRKPIEIVLGKGPRGEYRFRVDDLPNCNFAVLGLSGIGKSRLLTDVVRQWTEQGGAAAVIDPGGDLAEDILAYSGRRAATAGAGAFRRLHWFQPGSYDVLPRVDWLRFDPARPIHPELLDNARRLALHVSVAQVGELVQLKQGQVDFEQNARLQRILTDFLTASGTAIDASGLHLPMGLLYAMLLPEGDPQGDELYGLIAPRLDRATRADFERIRSYRREEDRMREVESFINRTRAILGPAARAMYSDRSGEVVNFRDIIREGGVQMWNLRPSPYFSHDDKRTFGQLAIWANLTAMLTMPREMRVPFLLMIDEASELNNEMLLWALGAMRKTGTPCSIWLAGQDLSSFKKGDEFDMRPKLLSQCNVISFNQKWPEDTELLSRILYGGDLSFKELVHEVERHDGYEWHEVTEHASGGGGSENWTSSDAAGETRASGTQHGTARQTNSTWTNTRSDAQANGTGSSNGAASNQMESASVHDSPVLVDGKLVNTLRVGSSGGGNGTSVNQSNTNTATQTHTDSSSKGGGESLTDSASVTESLAVSGTHTEGRGGGKNWTASVSHKKVPLARVKREPQKTGQLERSVADQLEQFRQRLGQMGKREAVVKLHGHKAAVEIVTREVKDAFRAEAARERAIAWAKREIFARRGYYFVPDFSPEEEERLLRQFLDAARRAPGGPARQEQPHGDGEPEQSEVSYL